MENKYADCTNECYFMLEVSSFGFCTRGRDNGPIPICFKIPHPMFGCRFDSTSEQLAAVTAIAKKAGHMENILQEIKESKQIQEDEPKYKNLQDTFAEPLVEYNGPCTKLT